MALDVVLARWALDWQSIFVLRIDQLPEELPFGNPCLQATDCRTHHQYCQFQELESKPSLTLSSCRSFLRQCRSDLFAREIWRYLPVSNLLDLIEIQDLSSELVASEALQVKQIMMLPRSRLMQHRHMLLGRSFSMRKSIGSNFMNYSHCQLNGLSLPVI